jgi:fibronectin type 3 domain-containing protein
MFGSWRNLSAVCLGLLVIAMVGCGRKTDLVLPQSLVPVAIKDLRYSLDEKGVTLQWSYPYKMETGDELTEIDSFEVFRAAMPDDDYCDGCPVRFDKPIIIDGDVLPDSGRKKTARYTEGNLQIGFRYIYKVRSRAKWWYPSRDSNRVSFIWMAVPQTVEGLQIRIGDRTLTLDWQPVSKVADGSGLAEKLVYQVYRSQDDKKYEALGEPVAGNSFKDVRVENNKRYFYRVRALRGTGNMLQAGPASTTVSGVPGDMTPPSPPLHLVAIRVSAGIKLIWQALGDNDLAGYRIYRRHRNSKEPERIGEVVGSQNQYIDTQPVTYKSVYYSVTAFDNSKPANESIASMEAVVQKQ